MPVETRARRVEAQCGFMPSYIWGQPINIILRGFLCTIRPTWTTNIGTDAPAMDRKKVFTATAEATYFGNESMIYELAEICKYNINWSFLFTYTGTYIYQHHSRSKQNTAHHWAHPADILIACPCEDEERDRQQQTTHHPIFIAVDGSNQMRLRYVERRTYIGGRRASGPYVGYSCLYNPFQYHILKIEKKMPTRIERKVKPVWPASKWCKPSNTIGKAWAWYVSNDWRPQMQQNSRRKTDIEAYKLGLNKATWKSGSAPSSTFLQVTIHGSEHVA